MANDPEEDREFERADRDELLRRLDEASRNGSVTATKLLLEELRRESDDTPGSEFDELDDNVTPFRRRSA